MTYTLLIYNAVLLFACALAFGVRISRGGWEWLFRLLLFLVLWVPAALRYGIGTDYASYASIFYSPSGELARIEPGYAWLNYAIMACGGQAEWLFALVSLLTYAPVAFCVRRKHILPVVVLFVLTMYLASYSTIRQSLAVVWVLVALSRYIDDGEVAHTYVWIAAASTIHLSVLLVLPFVLVRRIHIPVWVLLLLLPVAYVVVRMGFIDFLFSSGLFLDSKYGVYAGSQFDKPTELGSGLGILLRMVIPLLYLVYSGRMGRRCDVVLYLVVAYIVAYMLSMQVHVFNRLVDVFAFAPVLAFSVMSSGLRKRAALVAVVLLLFVNFQKIIVANPSDAHSGLGIAPYKTLFEKY